MDSRKASLVSTLCHFSCAGLLLAPAWLEVVPGTLVAYQFGVPLSWTVLASLWLSLLVLTLVVRTLDGLARRRGWTPVLHASAGFLLAYVLLEPTRWLVAELYPALDVKVLVARFGKTAVFALPMVLGLAALRLVWKRPSTLARAGKVCLLAATALPLVCTFHMVRTLSRPTRAAASAGSVVSKEKRPDILLLIFDEWDYEFTFERRPGHLSLPEVDHWRASSTSFEHALPPSIMTLRSVPSILSGKLWQESRLRSDGHMEFRALDEPRAVTPAERTDVFSLASRAGFASRYVQWGLVPSRRYVAARPGLSVEHFDANPRYGAARTAYDRGIPQAMLHHGEALRWALRAPLGALWPVNFVAHHADLARTAEASLLAALARDDAALTVGHLPYPHPPAVFDARRNRFLHEPSREAYTLDNMVLVDRTLKAVRERLQASKRWDDMLIIATSDHWQRAATAPELRVHDEKLSTARGHRVPLLVKFKGQTQGASVHEATLNTVVFDLIKRALEGRTDSATTANGVVHTPPPDLLLRYQRSQGWHE